MLEHLKGLKKTELLEMAKGMQIKGRHSLSKDALIEAIILADGLTNGNNKVLTETTSATHKTNKDYIEGMQIGTLVAFTVGSKTISGKVERINKALREFTVATVNGIRFIVRYENVIWVRTGQRWPKGVYKALRGEVNG